MKKTLLFGLVMLLFSFSSFAQWTKVGNLIYPTDLNDAVGVGIATPAYLLHAAKNATEPHITIQNSGSNGGATFRMIDNNSGADFKFKSTFFGDFKIRDESNALDVLYIMGDGTGNVGLGTGAPPNKLSVVGNADVSDHFGIGTSVVFTGEMLSVIGDRGVGATIVDTSSAGAGVVGVNSNISTPDDGIGVLGLCNIYDYYGFGGDFHGGFIGARGLVLPSGGANQQYYGLVGVVNGGTAAVDGSVNMGVYGYANGADPTQNGAGPIGDWAVYADGEAYATVSWTASDERYKTNVNDFDAIGLKTIMQLIPKSYEFIQGDVIRTSGGKQYGFMAQELEKVIPEAVKNTHKPIIADSDALKNREKQNLAELKVVNHNALFPFIVKAIQEQQEEYTVLAKDVESVKNHDAEISSLKEKNLELEQKINLRDEQITSLQKSVDLMMKQLDQIDNDLQNCCLQHQGSNFPNSGNTVNEDNAHLAQNTPNPFNEKTVIKYYLPKGDQGTGDRGQGMIRVLDLKGTVLWRFDLVGSGYGQIEIDANTFAPATYVYELIIGDKRIDSKKMVIE